MCKRKNLENIEQDLADALILVQSILDDGEGNASLIKAKDLARSANAKLGSMVADAKRGNGISKTMNHNTTLNTPIVSSVTSTGACLHSLVGDQMESYSEVPEFDNSAYEDGGSWSQGEFSAEMLSDGDDY